MTNRHKHFYEFGPFTLHPEERRLQRNGEALQLTPKAFEVLLFLVENGGHVLRKEEFLQKVWAGSYVEEKNLADNISLLRKTLGDDPKSPSFIETVPRLGYRFVADVREVRENAADVLLAERTRAHIVVEEDVPAVEIPPEGVEGAAPVALLPVVQRKRAAFAAALVGGVLVALFAVYYLMSRRATVPTQPAEVRSLAVLPFKPLGPSVADEDYLGLGMTDALITKLSNLRQLAVRPTSAVLKYGGAQADLAAVGREQQVDAVLTGNFQRTAERVRVTVQLVRASDGRPLWAETFDEKFTDMFAVQDAISSRLADALQLRLSSEEQHRLTKRQTQSADAYQLYLRGRYHWNRRTADGMHKAVEYLTQAVRTDPSYALAHAALADAYALLPEYTNGPLEESTAKAKAAALEALRIDNTLAEAYVSLAYVKQTEWDWAGVEENYRRGLELNPNYATGHQWYSEYLVINGRLEEALKEILRAQQLDPLSLIINARLGMTLYYSRRYDGAIEQLRRTLEFNPDFILCHVFLYAAFVEKGMLREAIPHIVKGTLNIHSPEDISRIEAGLRAAYDASGERGLWERVRDTLQSAEKRDYNSAYSIAAANMRLGDKDEAFLWLNRAADQRHPGVAALKAEPAMDALRSDPRYADLLRRINLSE